MRRVPQRRTYYVRTWRISLLRAYRRTFEPRPAGHRKSLHSRTPCEQSSPRRVPTDAPVIVDSRTMTAERRELTARSVFLIPGNWDNIVPPGTNRSIRTLDHYTARSTVFEIGKERSMLFIDRLNQANLDSIRMGCTQFYVILRLELYLYLTIYFYIE